MSDSDRHNGDRDCGGDVAAYALGSLDRAEAAAFTRHLESCAACRDDLAGFQGVVDALPMSVPVHPLPPGVRQRVLDAVQSSSVAQPEGRRAARARQRSASWRVARPALAFGAAVVLAVAVFVGFQLNTSSTPSARVISAQVTGQGTAQLRVTGSRGELVLHSFSPPPAGQVYEVWLKRPGKSPAPTSALFSVTADGSGDVDVPGSLRGVTQVMVTPEPAGGSRVPTHPPVVQANLT
ncbi:MAG: anti-sigma factor [Solirubrobacteraceae bacterium]